MSKIKSIVLASCLCVSLVNGTTATAASISARPAARPTVNVRPHAHPVRVPPPSVIETPRSSVTSSKTTPTTHSSPWWMFWATAPHNNKDCEKEDCK
jgi:hypothetical protein